MFLIKILIKLPEDFTIPDIIETANHLFIIGENLLKNTVIVYDRIKKNINEHLNYLYDASYFSLYNHETLKNILSIGEETKELFQKLLSLKVSVFIKNISKEGFQKKLSKNWSFKTLYKEIVEYEKEDSSFGSLKILEAVLSSHSAENIDLISLKRLIGEDDYIEEVKMNLQKDYLSLMKKI